MCLAEDHNVVTPVRLEPGFKHSTNEPLCSKKSQKYTQAVIDRKLLMHNHLVTGKPDLVAYEQQRYRSACTSASLISSVFGKAKPKMLHNFVVAYEKTCLESIIFFLFCLFDLILYVTVNNFFSYVRMGLLGLNQC